MPLHRRDDVRHALNADIYGTRAADASAPKYKLGRGELRADVAHAMVRDELFLDGNARQTSRRSARPGSIGRSTT